MPTLLRTIERLEEIYMREYKLKTKEDYAVLKVAIEAMKAIKIDRFNRLPFRCTLLPGETEDKEERRSHERGT